MRVAKHQVEFTSDGTIVRGWLFMPEVPNPPAPAVVMIHGFSATINGMVADRYAAAFAEVGLAVLLFDTRGFGVSDGQPRQEIDPWSQARDYMAGIDFLEGTEGVDSARISVWGDSLSARVAAVVAAVDARVAAAVLQVPAFGREVSPPDVDGSQFAQIAHTLLDADLSSFERTVRGPLPVVSTDQQGTPSFLTPVTAFHFFITYGARWGTRWENQATMATLDTPAPFDAQICVPHIRAPLLMVVADEDEMPGANADVARQAFATAGESSELLEISGGHFGLLYHDGPVFEVSVRGQRDFLVKHLLG